ncbi:MAG: glycine zipper 2TM domain-containing protein [Rickettsiales bacterium]
MTKNQKILLGSVIAVVALAGTAIAASYVTRETLTAKAEPQVAPQQRAVRHAKPQRVAAQQPVAAPCNDHNIVGTVGGGVAGALVGNQFGGGSGKTLATLGGAAGGAYLGHEYIPTRGSTCN